MGIARRPRADERRRGQGTFATAALGLLCALAVLLSGCSIGSSSAASPSATRPGGHIATLTTLNPHPFDPSVGAPLPNDRIVAAYGIVGGSQVNGPASEISPPDDLLDAYMPQLQQLGQQYAALDPVHPVKLALDLVVDTFSPCYIQYCGGWADPGTIDAYVAFCQAHNLLLFFDLQLGTEPVEHAVVNHVLSYLQKYPFTELALDTEFHFPNTAQGYAEAAAYDLGSMGSDEINWAIDQLAQISTQHQLPRKVLVIHEWNSGVLPDKDQIAHNANVSVVLQSDGFGNYSAKLGDYQVFVQQDLLEYGGYKLFYHYCDGHCSFDIDYTGVARVQTPQEVMQLFPQPLFVSYQ